MKVEYINNVLKQIKNNNAKKSIEQELDSHIADKIDYYLEIGYPPDQAEQMAVEEMGSPDEIAVPLASLHNDVKWYKKYELWICLAVVLLLAFFDLFYPLNFKYTDSTLSIIHFVSIDFVSLLIIASIVYLIHLMRKRHNLRMIIPIFCILSFSFFQSIFEPALYAIAKICTSGFGGYIDSIFGYSYAHHSLYGANIAVKISAVVLIMFFIVLCLWTAYVTYGEQICKNVRKLKKGVVIAEKVLCCFLVINLIIMSTATVIAACELDNKRNENYYTRRDMIDFYLANDKNNISVKKILNIYDKGGYSFIQEESQISTNTYVCNRDNAAFALASFNYGCDNSVLYSVTTLGVNSLLNDDLVFEESDFDKFKRNMEDKGEETISIASDPPAPIFDEFEYHAYTNQAYDEYYYEPDYDDLNNIEKELKKQAELPKDKRPYTMEEFLADEIYANAYEVSHNGGALDEISETFQFSFKLKNSKYNQVTMGFCCNMLVIMSFSNDFTEVAI